MHESRRIFGTTLIWQICWCDWLLWNAAWIFIQTYIQTADNRWNYSDVS